MNDTISCRFIRVSDPDSPTLPFRLPLPWWSRPYEYAWAEMFANTEYVVLDAACGVEHPFKVWLSYHCKKTYACDIDPAIESSEAILQRVAAYFGYGVAYQYMQEALSRMGLVRANIAALPYDNSVFDVVFCLSSLEHMTCLERSNALAEFFRVLKSGGLLVTTIDVPTITPKEFINDVENCGLKVAGDVDTVLPEDALVLPDYLAELWKGRLYIYRSVFMKA